MRKRDFARLFKAYGARAIAGVVGVTAQTVRRWAREGLPAARSPLIDTLETVRRHEGYEEKSLREMMRLASDKLPSANKYSKKRDGEKTTGWETSFPHKAFLNEATLLRVRSELEHERMARGLPNWIASATISAYVEDAEKVGSGDRLVYVNHGERNNFVAESIISSGLCHSRQEAIEVLTEKLQEKMNDEGKFFVHSVYFSTYEYKSEDDARELRTRRRRERKRKNG